MSSASTLSLREVAPGRRVTLALGIVAFILATSLSAYVAVPMPLTPVPVTLQPLFVILAGALLGPWAGAAAMVGYLMLGIGGAPVFSAGHGGLPWLLGPTGGYLVACPAAAFLVGALARDTRHWLRLTAALAAGIAVLYVGGVSQLWILTRADLAGLLALGVIPFLIGDLVKVLLALAVTRTLRGTRPGLG